MLKVVLSEDQVYEFDQNKLMAQEASMLQKYTGRTIQEWQKGLQDGDVDCTIALVWLAMKRNGEVIRYEDVDFDLAALDVIDPDKAKEDAEDAEAKEADEAVDPLASTAPIAPPSSDVEPPASA